jgi:hypothetical protein
MIFQGGGAVRFCAIVAVKNIGLLGVVAVAGLGSAFVPRRHAQSFLVASLLVGEVTCGSSTTAGKMSTSDK